MKNPINNDKYKSDENIYSRLVYWELTGILRLFRKHDPVGFFTNTTAAIDIILSHPDFTEEKIIEKAGSKFFRWIKEEERGMAIWFLQEWMRNIKTIDNNTLIRYIVTCNKILWLSHLSIGLLSNEVTTPLLVFSETMRKWLTDIAGKFEQLKATHDSYIIIRPGLDSFQKEKNSIGRFVKTSKEEIEELLSNIQSHARKPYALYKICERIEREYLYIKEERDDLRWKIATAVKDNKQKNTPQSASLSEANDCNDWLSGYNSEIDKASQEIHTLLVRVWNMRKKTWWKIMRYLRSEQDPTEELEKIQERANILSRRFPELEDVTRYIHDEIWHYHGFSSSEVETLVAESTACIVDNKPVLKIASEWTERDFFAGKIINEYILYLGAIGSSTNATKENSIWDWRTFNQTLVPFLRFCINNLSTWKIQAENFSIWGAFRLFQDGVTLSVWNSKRSLQVYEDFFLSRNVNGPFLETFPAILDTLFNIWKIIENWRVDITGCGILIKRSQDFFGSNEWKSLWNKYQKCKN